MEGSLNVQFAELRAERKRVREDEQSRIMKEANLQVARVITLLRETVEPSIFVKTDTLSSTARQILQPWCDVATHMADGDDYYASEYQITLK